MKVCVQTFTLVQHFHWPQSSLCQHEFRCTNNGCYFKALMLPYRLDLGTGTCFAYVKPFVYESSVFTYWCLILW